MTNDDEFWIYVEGIPDVIFSNKGGIKKPKPVNYDFESNWSDIILPLLQLPVMKKAIYEGISNWINKGNIGKNIKYNSTQCPASYMLGNKWIKHMEKYKNYLNSVQTEKKKNILFQNHYYVDKFCRASRKTLGFLGRSSGHSLLSLRHILFERRLLYQWRRKRKSCEFVYHQEFCTTTHC